MQIIFRIFAFLGGISMLELKVTNTSNMPNIAIVGIGGGGCNAISRMSGSNFSNITYIALNTDLQSLEDSHADKYLQIGQKLTLGFGAGADPSIGESSAKESEEDIENILKDFNMVILTCGLGGGTGTGAIPVVAQICRSLQILTVAVVTLPFTFENTPRAICAKNGLEKLRESVDTLLVIPNDKLLEISEKTFYLNEAFEMADTILKYTIEGITNIIFNRGIVNLDFNDLKTTLKDKGNGHLGIGTVPNGTSILEAVKQAIHSPLLDTSIKGASNILLNSSGQINLVELNEAIAYVRELAGESVNIIWGTVTDAQKTNENIVITLIATGMNEEEKQKNIEEKQMPKEAETFQTSTQKTFTQKAPVQNRPIYSEDIVIPSFLREYYRK